MDKKTIKLMFVCVVIGVLSQTLCRFMSEWLQIPASFFFGYMVSSYQWMKMLGDD